MSGRIAWMYVSAPHVWRACGAQWIGTWHLWAAMWGLGLEFESSGRAASALHRWAISLAVVSCRTFSVWGLVMVFRCWVNVREGVCVTCLLYWFCILTVGWTACFDTCWTLWSSIIVRVLNQQICQIMPWKFWNHKPTQTLSLYRMIVPGDWVWWKQPEFC